MTPTGPDLARQQLAALQQSTQGAVQVLAEPEDDDDPFLVSLDTHGIPAGAGVRVGGRERFRIFIPAGFPFQHPRVHVAHRRWRGSPHVQWGDLLCLYAAPSVEWNPADGMRGFLERLLTWLERAAAGDLDPDGQPLHPPIAYRTIRAGHVVVHPDLGDRVPWTEGDDTEGATAATLYAWCVRDAARVEVLQWLTFPQVVERIVSDDDTDRCDEHGRRGFLVATVLLSTELGWEYPDTARGLAAGTAASGFAGDELLLALVRTAALNRLLRDHDGADRPTDPVILLIGTPSRRLAGSARLAHLVAWKLDELGGDITDLLRHDDVLSIEALDSEIGDLARRWLAIAKVEWMQVHETRPEVTCRRDQHTPAAWLAGKQILLLGCGALGAQVAEHCVRAGAHVTVLDNSTVTPGILVRQPYAHSDVGRPKATALAARLNTLTRVPMVTAKVANAVTALLDPRFDPTVFDLVIDATADVGTRTTVERVRTARRADWPPLATMIIGHRAERGVVCLSRPGAAGAGHDVLRRVALHAHGAAPGGWTDIAEDLFPDPPRTSMFSPEPGCSGPTFVGSAAQVAALAAQLLLRVLDLLAEQDGPPMAAAAARVGTATGTDTAAGHLAASSTLSWSDDVLCVDEANGFEVRISASAVTEICAETRRAHRVHGPRVETGGMLLGAVDDALGVIHVDLATGPPPDSRLSALHFEHGLLGTQAAVDHHQRRTGRRTGYVGLWHTHPYGPARPSSTDTTSLATLTTGPGAGPWALMLIFAGAGRVWERWRDEAGPPEVYAATVHRGRTDAPSADDSVTVQRPPTLVSGPWFPGGFAGPAQPGRAARATPAPCRTAWWHRRRARR